MEANHFSMDTGYCPEQLKVSEVLATPQDGVVDQMADAQRARCAGLIPADDFRSLPTGNRANNHAIVRRHPSYLRQDGGASITRIATSGSARRAWLPA